MIENNMAARLKAVKLVHPDEVHEHIRRKILTTLPGIGEGWAKKITEAFTKVERRRVSPETIELQAAQRKREEEAMTSAQKFAASKQPERPLPKTPRSRPVPCLTDGHQGHTVYSNPSLTRVGRACHRCSCRWEEDWSRR